MVHFQVIFFNAGGTLLQLKGTTLPILYSEKISEILDKKISSEDTYQAFRKAESWVLTRKIPGGLFSDLDQRKYQNVFYGHLGITSRKEINKIERKIAEEIVFDSSRFVLENDAIQVLQLLKTKYQLGIISNWDDSLLEILQDFKIYDFFDSITLSEDIGANKPDLDIFSAALDDFPEVKPKETVYIGDEYQSDVLPAQKLKIFAILFDKGPSGMHGRPFQPDVSCPRITELIELPKILFRHTTGNKH
ncbi:MAG: HAD hydrolase-like protein [Promethearchaeota archaeon]